MDLIIYCWIFLKQILGIGMSDKMWEVTIKHAMTCDMGSKIYIYSGPQFTIYLNPICKLIKAHINGQIFSSGELSHMNKVVNNIFTTNLCNFNLWITLYMLDFDPLSHLDVSLFKHLQSYIDKLVKEAYARWHNLEEIDEVLNDNIALLTQGTYFKFIRVFVLTTGCILNFGDMRTLATNLELRYDHVMVCMHGVYLSFWLSWQKKLSGVFVVKLFIIQYERVGN